ncbi:MAG TPA: membrane protein insertase YidC [Ktedonobacterales bacterium]|nr:membrane protein insertase YidC [Ktedonobacterales bacterium]
MEGILNFFGTLFGPIGQIFHYIFYLPVYNILMVTYEGLNKVIPGGAFALAIIILTLLIRAALIPLTRKQLQSTRKMQMIQPELKALKERYRGDPQGMMAEQRQLYKDNGVSMYGGCLPLLVQMPFIYALYGAFLTVIHAAALSAPQNLAAINQDLYSFVPHITSFPQTWFIWTSLVTPDPLHILPVLAALLTFIQLRMAMPVRKPRQPGENPDPTMQATATTQYIMPVVTLFIGWTFPAGLALYWCISTGFSAVQQYFINGNWGSLFVGVPGMEHLVPAPRDISPTVTRTPATASAVAGGGSARALTAPATSAPEESGLRGWWNRMKESVTAAQAQAVNRAEETRRQLEASRAQQASAESANTSSKSGSSPARRQRPSRQGPVLVKPPRPAATTTQNTQNGDEIDTAIQQATDQTVLPEQEIANGAKGNNGANGATKAKSSNGTGGAKAPNGSNGARAGVNGARSATNSGGNGPRKNTAKGGSGGQSRNGSGRSKKGR